MIRYITMKNHQIISQNQSMKLSMCVPLVGSTGARSPALVGRPPRGLEPLCAGGQVPGFTRNG
ncbi:hypothetical protein CBZ_17880 [Cellulomonas biazotea]|uniref:Uncharacterized protein n=1 Tax=Cellulomonas biazotea TaxID=1709 RepID=A0A402DRI0_9CELL|nr:hypothetical protein CBZ_17880 [Cellulomonas biazotea]